MAKGGACPQGSFLSVLLGPPIPEPLKLEGLWSSPCFSLPIGQGDLSLVGVEVGAGVVSDPLAGLAHLCIPDLVSPSHGFRRAFSWALEKAG